MALTGIGNPAWPRVFGRFVGCWLALICVQLVAQDEPAKEPPPVNEETVDRLAALVRVHLPLTGTADQALQSSILRARDSLLHHAKVDKIAERPVLVLQLDSQPLEDGTTPASQFERAFSLARFLCSRDMGEVKTIAYVPHNLRGHGVLLALACEEIVMSGDAMIGEAGADETEQGAIRQTLVAAYREIAETQRTIPVALAVAMIDSSNDVLRVEAEDGTHFISRADLEKFAADHEIIKEEVLIPAGSFAQFDGREGRQFGFVKYLASNQAGLAKALGVSADSLVEDESLAEEWKPVVIDIAGEITPKVASRLDTLLGVAVQQQGANLICLRIDSAGGDVAAGLRMAAALARLDPNSIRTIAYIPAEASGVAGVVALSCNRLVMHPKATLSAAAPPRPAKQGPLRRPDPLGPAEAQLAAGVQSIRQSLSARTSHPWSLLAAMIDPNIKLASYQHRETGDQRLMSAEELAEQPDAAKWQVVKELGGERLSFTGATAFENGLSWRTVDSFDQLKQHFGIQGDVPNPQPNMALEFVEALATPELAMILLIVGFAGIYMELRSPGVGVGAFVGSVALLLFFWSKYLNGTAGWLEVMLFLAGFTFVLLEVFVLPGFGIFGLGGGAMMLASLILASLTFIRPHSEVELNELARSVGCVALAGMAVMAFIVVSRRYLPQAPMFRNIVLEPPEADEIDTIDHREALVDFSALVGEKGFATTDLRPAGKARINHELVDVIAEGEPLPSGAEIIVIEARGSRVVVRGV
jgi:membrane-bound serine protease (ClpP class)